MEKKWRDIWYKVTKEYANVSSITILFLSLIMSFYFILKNENKLLVLVLIFLFLSIYWRWNYYKDILHEVLDIINESKKIREYVVELVFFGIFITVIIGLMMLWITPSPEIKVSCNSVDYPNVEITIKNPTKTEFTDFNLIIMDNWINGTIFLSFEKPIFYGISSSLCTINDTNFTEKSYSECKLPSCPYINNKPTWETYAINIKCEYVPRNTELEFSIPLFPIGKDGIGRPSPYEKKGLVLIKYWSREQKLTDTFVDCNEEKPLCYAYPVEARQGKYDPATYYFLRNGWGIYSDTLIILSTIIVIIIIFLIFYRRKKKWKIKQ